MAPVFKSQRALAWRNVMVVAVNAAIKQGVFTLDIINEDDGGWHVDPRVRYPKADVVLNRRYRWLDEILHWEEHNPGLHDAVCPQAHDGGPG